MRSRVLLTAALFAGLAALPAAGQTFSFQPKSSDQPIVVEAENGFEIDQDAKRVVFHGNARASQGEVSIVGDELIAHYREMPDGSNELYRVFAVGNVTMRSAEETATGATAVYDFDKAVLVLEGDDVRLTNAGGTVTSHRALQYWAGEKVAVAEGSAVAEDSEKRKVFADKLVAFFREDSPGAKPVANAAARRRGDITYMQGFGNVRVETPKETARGQRATYNVETGVVTLDGDVKMTQNNGPIITGEYAIVPLKGGIARILPSRPGGASGTRENARVKALIAPSSKPDPVPAKVKP